MFHLFHQNRKPQLWSWGWLISLDEELSQRKIATSLPRRCPVRLPGSWGRCTTGFDSRSIALHFIHEWPTRDSPDHLSTNGTFFNTHCTNCGGVCCFADDSTYTISGKNTEALNATLDNSFKKIESYMSDNKLVLNSDKTHLLVMSSEAKHRKNGNFGIFLETETKVIQPQKSEQLLGGIIANNFKFNAHLKDDEKSLFRTLTSRVNALSKVCSVANFKTRKQIADGIVMSKLVYLIQLWGGCSGYLLDFLQVLQNWAARMVTRLSWFTPISTLLKQCGWLSVRQLVHYHSVLLCYKMMNEGKPTYFVEKFNFDFPYETRLATGNCVRQTKTISSDPRKYGFVNRTTEAWNRLPLKHMTPDSWIQWVHGAVHLNSLIFVIYVSRQDTHTDIYRL